MGCGVNCSYPTGSVADQIGNSGQCLTCHSADGADRFPEPIEQQSNDQNLKHGLAMVGSRAGAGKSIEHHRKPQRVGMVAQTCSARFSCS